MKDGQGQCGCGSANANLCGSASTCSSAHGGNNHNIYPEVTNVLNPSTVLASPRSWVTSVTYGVNIAGVWHPLPFLPVHASLDVPNIAPNISPTAWTQNATFPPLFSDNSGVFDPASHVSAVSGHYPVSMHVEDDFNAYETDFIPMINGYDIVDNTQHSLIFPINVATNSVGFSNSNIQDGFGISSAQAVGNPPTQGLPHAVAAGNSSHQRFTCTSCLQTFKRDKDRIRHENNVHRANPTLGHYCPIQGCVKNQAQGYSRADKVTEHLWKVHGNLGYTKRT